MSISIANSEQQGEVSVSTGRSHVTCPRGKAMRLQPWITAYDVSLTHRSCQSPWLCQALRWMCERPHTARLKSQRQPSSQHALAVVRTFPTPFRASLDTAAKISARWPQTEQPHSSVSGQSVRSKCHPGSGKPLHPSLHLRTPSV